MHQQQAAGPQGEDPYSLNPIPQTLEETQRQILTEMAKNFQHQWEKFKAEEFFTRTQYYLLSAKYFERWKVYVGYEEIISDHQPNKFFGSGPMPVINEDIVQTNVKFDIKFLTSDNNYNVALKSGLQEGKDYIFLSEELWEIITRQVDYDKMVQVKRKVVSTDEGKKVELYYQKLAFIPISNQILKDVEYERIPSLSQFVFQVSHYTLVRDLMDLVSQEIRLSLSSDYYHKIESNPTVKLWLAAQKTQKTIMYNTFLQGCKANSTFQYKLYFQGSYMDNDKKLSEYDLFDDSLIVIEFKEYRQEWCLFNKQNILIAACANCRNIDKLNYLCSCKCVAYCSKTCQLKDRTYHEGRCPTNAESQEEETQMKETENSRKGVVGLRNLGNTCFMNSGLQCISHVLEMTEYFLTNKFVKDINKDNPLGTQGQLCAAFAKMLKNLWYGSDSSFSPTQLKRAIGKFQPMFSGYNQHDSGELITYLLDGLHEDLNRVKKKPYVETKQYDGRPDPIIAKEQWHNFLLRNQSEVVDLMYGQYRSVVDCPQCSYRSIQFDPFCLCSLPIINNSFKRIEVTYLQKNLRMHKMQISFDKSWNWKMSNLSDEIKKKVGNENKNLIFYVASYATCEIIDVKRSVNEVRSEYKYRTIFVRELLDEENPNEDIKVVLGNTICHTYYKDESYRKSLSQYRLHFFKKTSTLKEIHHKLYQMYKDVWEINDYQAEVINAQKDDQPLRLMAIATARYAPCEYCSKKGCDGCIIPYEDTPLQTYVKEVEEDKVEFELYWRNHDKEIQAKFDDYETGKAGNDDSSIAKKGETSLQDCLRLFQESETLGEDNAWYCPKCKDFVLAKKQMQIYKAPKILILCLKRFKRKEYWQQKYNILVDFPIENLDLSQFVINSQLPCGHEGEEETKAESNMDEEKPLLYDLFAISNHFGGTGGGHYTAYCKNPLNGQWYDFDDSYVRELGSKNDLVSESAYILFYRRKN